MYVCVRVCELWGSVCGISTQPPTRIELTEEFFLIEVFGRMYCKKQECNAIIALTD